MKKLLFTLFLGITSMALAQVPQQINYQGVARNTSGTVLANQAIGIKLDLHQGSATGAVVFAEAHTKTTNAFGLFTLGIGSANAPGFVGINWANGPYFLEVSIDPAGGTSYVSVGTQQFISVPYALYSGSAPAPAVSYTNNILSVGGNTATISSGTTYTAGFGIDVTGNSISNTAPDLVVTLTPAGSTSVTGTYPNFTISSPAAINYSAGSDIAITSGSIVNTAPDQTVTITGINSATVTGSYPNFTVNVPTSSLPNALNGQFLYNTGTIWDTLPRNNFYFDGTNIGIGTTSPAANFHVVGAGKFDASVSTPHVFTNTVTVSGGTLGQVLTSDASGNGTFQNLPIPPTPTITSTGIAVVTPTTGNTFNVDVPVPILSYTSGTNVLSLTQGTTVTTATLNGTGSNTVSIVGSGLASVTPTTGSTFTVSVPNPTLSIASGSLSISNGNSVAIPSPSLTINSNSLTINGPGGNTITLPTTAATTLTSGSNVSVSGISPNYTISSVTPTLNVVGASLTGSYPTQTLTIPTSSTTVLTASTNVLIAGTAPSYTISSPFQTLGVNSNSISISGGNTIVVPTSSVVAGNSNITVTPSGNTYSVSAASYSLTSNSNTLTLSNGSAITTATVPAATLPLLSYTSTASNGVLQSGPGTNTVSIPNYTLSNTSNTITLNNGIASSIAVLPVPTLSLTGTTLSSGPTTNSVSLSGFNGIYGGSGAIQTGSTTVTVGTNTLTFLSGATAGKSIANFFGGGITGTHLAIGHIGANNAAIRLLGSTSATPVDYGYVLGSTNGISISGGTSSNGFYATNNAEVGVGTFTTGTGKFVITHTASQANPTMHLRETTGGLNRIKFSNNTVANKFFETAAQNNATDANAAYSINYFDGTTYKPVLLITGERKVNINNLNTVLGSFHVMDNATTAGNGIIAEGFAQAAQINLARNNQPGLAARTAVLSGDELGRLNFSGFDGSSFGDGAKIYAKAVENVTGSNKGTELIFAAVPTGTNTNKDAFKINGSGKLEVITSMIIPFGSAAGKVLTSDALGNASWQNGAAASPWIQGSGIVTLTSVSDMVGIGTSFPSAQFDVLNTYASSPGLRVTNNTTGLGTYFAQNGSGIGLYSAVSNTANFNPAIQGDHSGSGTTIYGSNSGTGRAGTFAITNATSSANALEATSYGTGSSIYAYNTNTANIAAIIQANQISSGVAIYANNTSGPTAQFDNNSSSTAFNAINNGTGIAIYASANSGNALNAASTGSSNPTALISNSGTGDAMRVFSSGSRAILAQSSSNGTAALEVNNTGTGIGITGIKGGTSTGGNVASFTNNSTSNGADAVMVVNNGTGAAVHAVSGPTVAGSSNTALLLENGHIDIKQPAGSSVSSVDPISVGFGGITDVAGTTRSTGAIVLASGVSGNGVTITFGKPYKNAPIVTLTANSPLFAELTSYVVSNINGFTVFYKNSTSGAISIVSGTDLFSYHVIGRD